MESSLREVCQNHPNEYIIHSNKRLCKYTFISKSYASLEKTTEKAQPGFGKLPLKCQIFQFFPLGQKKSLRVGSKSTRVKGRSASWFLRVKSKLGSGWVRAHLYLEMSNRAFSKGLLKGSLFSIKAYFMKNNVLVSGVKGIFLSAFAYICYRDT